MRKFAFNTPPQSPVFDDENIELFSMEQLKQHAVTLATRHTTNMQPGQDKLLPRLKDNAQTLQEVHRIVAAAATLNKPIIPAEAWLLDNYYLIEQKIQLVRRHLPRGYSRQLPRLTTGPLTGFPRIYVLALELIARMDGSIDLDTITQFISAYQTVEPLKLGELWAFPIMLKLALIENLRRVAVRVARRREELDAASDWADRMQVAAETKPQQLVQLLAKLARTDLPISAPFVEQFYARLVLHGPPVEFVRIWLTHQLREQGLTATQLAETASRAAATNQISIANSIDSLRFISAADWKDFVESLSAVEKILRQDPSVTYSTQDFATRDRYRHVIESIAKGSSCSECKVAQQAIHLAQAAAQQLGTDDRTAHVGYYLIDQGRPKLEQSVGCRLPWRTRLSRISRRYAFPLYLSAILLITVLTTAVALLPFNGFAADNWRYWLFALLSFIASSALAMSLVNRAVTLITPPQTLPRLDFSQGIPNNQRTMVVVPTLLSQTKEVDDLVEALEIRYLGNRDANLFFALLTDFRDAEQCTLPGDESLLAYARSAIEALNQRYQDDRPHIFFLFHRPRTWNPIEQVWMGYERKRGKLKQFNSLLRGNEQAAFSEQVGDLSILTSIKYVITLDTDTTLPRETAATLIGNIAHPLNQPVYCADKGRIVAGHAILQPRASIGLSSASQSRFTQLCVGEVGVDPYTREVSDVYQDIFGEGSFVGKGIYHVDAFRQAVDGRFPENLILSHDLLEGGYARSALVTDVDLTEEHPVSYLEDISRRHRWMRGDWQLASWLLSHVPAANDHHEKKARQPNPLSLLSKWKIADNLRRSLVSPAALLLLAAGWLFGPGPVWFWLLLVISIFLIPPLFSMLLELLQMPKERTWRVYLRQTCQSAVRPFIMAGLTILFLPYEALICLDAILRSGVRMLFTRRGLLIWHLPSYATRNARKTLTGVYAQMWIAPTAALLLAAVLWQVRSAEWLHWIPLLLLWFLSPIVAWWISTPLRETTPELTLEQQIFLRTSARRTWRFFADFVAPLDNWLAPDNVQVYPATVIASRTSPTNMGMALLAELTAYDFGYISADECLRRISNSLTTMEKLERYKGHFYNWYDTRTLLPLPPRYVSAVDSGNLVGSLLTLQAGLTELKDAPVLPSKTFQGLQDTLLVLAEHLPNNQAELVETVRALKHSLTILLHSKVPQTLMSADAALSELQQLSGQLSDLTAVESDAELVYWVHSFAQQLHSLQADLRTLVPELRRFDTIPTLSALAKTRSNGFPAAHPQAAIARLRTIDNLIIRCSELAMMDFEFLYDNACSLLAIGYDVDKRQRDTSYYDLLASEARIASFLLIAQGQVPQKHWFSLGRLLTSHGGKVTLISWSGSMFEYLMPQLFMRGYAHTLLHQACKVAVLRQIEYGRQRGVPWGVSESCYNAFDADKVYQYQAFGVPGLGLKRGLGADLVIAPYASALALTVMPLEACRNLQAMAKKGFLAHYGFYEAIDYTPSRTQGNEPYAIVGSFMAHHQGMSLLAYAHALLEQPMQRRFMSNPLVQATKLLLQERVPKQLATIQPHAEESAAAARPPNTETGTLLRIYSDPQRLQPEINLLSNGNYHVMATHTGGGYSRWHDLAITRWREDATCDNWGTFIYLRDMETQQYWSTTYQPTRHKADHYEAIFTPGRAEYRRRDKSIETYTEVIVSPEDDIEIRRVTLTNLSSKTRHIEVTSYAEVVLAPLTADLAHRVFSNLFVQTEIIPELGAILCTRRPRMPGEQVPWMFHLLAVFDTSTDAQSYETDRSQFIGRGRTPAKPLALDSDDTTQNNKKTTKQKDQRLSDTAGSVLDPIAAIRRLLTLGPDQSITLKFISGVADNRKAALALMAKCRDRHFIKRTFEMAWLENQQVLRQVNATETDAQAYDRLASSIIYATGAHRAVASVIARNQLGQSRLWRFSISGDLPIVLLLISNVNRINLVKQALQAHSYWRMKGLQVDLVIINKDFSGYRTVLQDQIMDLIHTGPETRVMDQPGGVFLRRVDELADEELILLQAVARVVLTDSTATLAEQVERRIATQHLPALLSPVLPPNLNPYASLPLPARERIFCNGLGGFSPNGREYVITLEPGQTTPAPWVNVIASPYIGTVVSESGGAYTWVENAHEFRLSTWHNDPLSDSSGEALYIRDEECGAFWSPTPLPAPITNPRRSGYTCRHGFGYSVFEHDQAGITSELTTYVAMDAPVKFVVIKLRNHSGRQRRLSLTGYWELVLGEWRHANMLHIVTEQDPHSGALFARNAYSREYASKTVFAQVSHDGPEENTQSLTGNRTEFIGRNGCLANPAALLRSQLSGQTGAALDPCAALQTHIELADGAEREVVFIFGAADDDAEAQELIQRFSTASGARHALQSVREYWCQTLGAVQVETPDPALDVLVNGWLLYQTLSSRILGRSGYYQSGGAYGFRDQLQDTLALLHAQPWQTREQILRCAGRQFPQGDVQHWWHPPSGQGVRTHFSDDYLWLPYVTSRYVLATGDTAILDESIHFLQGRELPAEEEAYYDQPQQSSEVASLYQHCVRAIQHGLRFGRHNLPLMGGGDWNDGMNLVGHKGQGESVWLAWFLYENLQLFADLAASREDMTFAELCHAQAAQLKVNIEANAWDGAWYRRAYFDDGTPLGSAENDECQIDSISQSWAVLSGAADPDRARQAMTAVDQRLVRRDAQLIQLFAPPFDTSVLEPGYIKGYVPGVRENGGQYTHAAIWAAMAFAKLDDRERAWELLAMLNPIHHGSTPDSMQHYKVEPYVMSADIYAAAPHTGRGGWTWYTGAAGWMYQLALETLLGLTLAGDCLLIEPCIPADWKGYQVRYRYHNTLYHITINCAEEQAKQVKCITLNGVEVLNAKLDKAIPLQDDHGEHHVVVTLGA